MITTALTSSCHLETFVPFYLRKKIPENAFLTLTVNYRKNCTEKQIMPFNTTLNGILNDMWCYLVIGSFDWKNCILQQIASLIRLWHHKFKNWYDLSNQAIFIYDQNNIFRHFWRTFSCQKMSQILQWAFTAMWQ